MPLRDKPNPVNGPKGFVEKREENGWNGLLRDKRMVETSRQHVNQTVCIGSLSPLLLS
jgi:hypothetical protein